MNKTSRIGLEEITNRVKECGKDKGWNYNDEVIKNIINQSLVEIGDALVKGEEISFKGYFTFLTAIQAERTAINLQTKDKMIIPQKRVPKCKFSKVFKECILLSK